MGKKVLVIGAGIAGLSAASYLQRNGFDTQVFEAHTLPGGLCTAWKRSGYTFDGCIHWLMGSGPASNLHEIWKELGAGDLRYIEWDVYATIRLSDGDSFTVYTDPSRLEAEMLRLGPEDGAVARALADGIRRVSRLDMPAAMDKMSLGERLALLARLPSALPLLKWMKRSVSELISPLRSEKLREAFRGLFGEAMEDFPAAGLFMMLGFMAKKSSGYPLGGSLAFARAIEAEYVSRGGKVRYGSKVDEILVENGAAVGLRGSWGEERGDYVISAADAQDCLSRMLGGRYRHPELDAALSAALPANTGTESGVADGAAASGNGRPDRPAGGLRPFPSLIYIGLGLDRDWSPVPHMQTFTLPEPLLLESGGLVVKRLSIRIFSFDPSMAPPGKTAATVMIETYNDGYWTGLRERDRAAYEEEKRETARKAIAALDAFLPGLAASVETVDVATPHSFIHYTNNRHGSFEGWLPTGGSLGRKIAKTLPGLANFYMIGQWLNPGGGLPPCGIDGRNLARRLCSAEGRRFRPD
ncbi:MAG TPA: NAD(P)/FAD-dependent oxidoreductase [Rectinemataceae bacterium]|nr:NAD(P)/FAD-dependent oxidoreductase [Rectinemataceae bacterium]